MKSIQNLSTCSTMDVVLGHDFMIYPNLLNIAFACSRVVDNLPIFVFHARNAQYHMAPCYCPVKFNASKWNILAVWTRRKNDHIKILTSKHQFQPMHHWPWMHWLSNQDKVGNTCPWAPLTISQYQGMYSVMPQPMRSIPHVVGHQKTQVCIIGTVIFKFHNRSIISYQ